jgi:ArsR family transcriptional regulator
LKVLKDAGLITDRPEGRWIHYSLNTDALKELEEIVRSLRDLSPRRGPSAKCC